MNYLTRSKFLNIKLIPLNKGGFRGLCFFRGYFTTPFLPLSELTVGQFFAGHWTKWLWNVTHVETGTCNSCPCIQIVGFSRVSAQPYMLWCIRAKARFGSSLSPQPEGWGYSPVVSMRDRVITPPFMAEIISAISMRLRGFTH